MSYKKNTRLKPNKLNKKVNVFTRKHETWVPVHAHLPGPRPNPATYADIEGYWSPNFPKFFAGSHRHAMRTATSTLPCRTTTRIPTTLRRRRRRRRRLRFIVLWVFRTIRLWRRGPTPSESGASGSETTETIPTSTGGGGNPDSGAIGVFGGSQRAAPAFSLAWSRGNEKKYRDRMEL